MTIKVLLINCLIFTVHCIGLNEEFVWTRINYDWSYFTNQRNTRNALQTSILFPGLTSNGNSSSSSSTPSNIDYQYGK